MIENGIDNKDMFSTQDMAVKTIDNAIDALESILEHLKGSELLPESFKEVEQECSFLDRMYNLTPFQCFMLSAMLDNDGAVSFRQLSRLAHCSQLRLYRYRGDAEELIKKRLIRRDFQHGDSQSAYKLKRTFGNAILNNQEFSPKPVNKMTNRELLKEIAYNLKECQHSCDENAYAYMISTIRQLFTDSKHLDMSSAICELDLSNDDLTMLSVAAVHLILMEEGNIGPMDYSNIWTNEENEKPIIESLDKGSSPLMKLGYMQLSHVNGHCPKGYYELTSKAYKDIFTDFNGRSHEREPETNHQIITPESITSKELFYNRKEGELVQRLADLLSKRKFRSVQRRMKQNGLRQGIACLFYGCPGTGKTETVLQLARQTGRAIILADFSKLRDKYVGESEKAVQAMFDQYESVLRHSTTAPILLLNEADAILTHRTEGKDHSSVDKMEHTIQNIILQAIERFEGILIATTNLVGNLDPAFERRFLYKIKFEKPTTEVKSKIWKSLMPDLEASETNTLASRFDFSGGQIENIKRKQVVDHLLYGSVTCFSQIEKLCEEEKLENKRQSAIGFK